LKYFRELCNRNPQKAVVLLFDNETTSPRPLKNFLKAIHINGEVQKQFEQDFYMRLLTESKLFLVINPLIPGKTECEIEDLFPLKVLEHKVGGRIFFREDNYDSKIYYGKNDFSKYIFANYQKIDFNGFETLLNTLNTIVELPQNSPDE
jgi:hypothetical protein